jgi:hypothetical protein
MHFTRAHASRLPLRTKLWRLSQAIRGLRIWRELFRLDPLRFGRNRKFADSSLEGDGFELPVPRQIGNAFTGAAPSSGAGRAMRKAAQPCSAASARIGATLPQRQAARIIIWHPFNPAPYPQHHRWLALSNGLAHDQNPAAAVGTRIATSASVRAEKRGCRSPHPRR